MELIDAGLVEFYEGHVAEYRDIAQRSYEFAEANVLPTGLPVRPDDVAVHIVPALEIDEDLREFLAGKKLRQKFWYRRFADLILDRLWEEIRALHGGSGGSAS